ncbi:MAG: hypothetical protein HFI21_03190 [Lachnospiraceae bacterium]|nr:hypothetical protein [Lachnospiraceae bacterium]
MHYYLATSRAQKEKQEPNGVLAHQAALAFPFVCGASRKPRKAFGFPRCPATGANPQKSGASRKPRKAFGFPRCPATGANPQKSGASRKPRKTKGFPQYPAVIANPQKNKSPQLCFKQKQLIIIKKQPYPPLHKPIPKSTHQENEQNSNRKEHILHGTK